MFRPLRPLTARWRPVGGEGLEHLSLRPVPGGLLAESVVIGEIDGHAFGVRYRIECDDGWHVRSLDLRATDGRALSLASDRTGNWRMADGATVSELAGCIDIDLQGSPFTNTLPIRRLNLSTSDGPVDLRIAYISFGGFAPSCVVQRYTCLIDRLLYRYENADGGFTAELPVDEDGLVTDYPTLFRRL